MNSAASQRTDGDTETQAEHFRDIAAQCLAAGCTGITTWGVDDGHTWLDPTLGQETVPLLLDEEYQPKPAYDAVREELAARC